MSSGDKVMWRSIQVNHVIYIFFNLVVGGWAGTPNEELKIPIIVDRNKHLIIYLKGSGFQIWFPLNGLYPVNSLCPPTAWRNDLQK